MSPARRRPLLAEVARLYPSLDDPEAAIRAGLVTVAGRFVDNPASLVAPGEVVSVRDDAPLRGEAKLAAALDHFGVDPAGRVALDAGASTGGFVRVLLARGARRVYAVEAGHGQLLGSLRQDERVVNLEGTNLGQLDRALVPDPVQVVTLDLSYLALATAAPQLAAVDLADRADAVVLVKPMFELGLATAPTDESVLPEAVERAAQGFLAAGWQLEGWTPSPVTGAKGSVEALMHARR
jgi:23S rRNA (cytidine1920-2'-O)/16S rRNA (cytidine1409-2'-O)-methyltransferase